MEIIIRKATTKDLQKVQELNLRLFEKEQKEYDSLLDLNWTFGKIGTNYYNEMISEENGCVLVAIVENKIIGYLCGGLVKPKSFRKLPIAAEVENTFVLDEFRSKGVGGKLYNEFIEWCKTKGVTKVRVLTYAKNNLAVKFYKKKNFKEFISFLEADIEGFS
jgi:GNAT superfamily N-acetyltransferase